MQAGLPFDFSGLWWMRDNLFPEYLLTFADLTCPDWPNDFEQPLTCTIKAERKHIWSWDNSAFVSTILSYYALTRDVNRDLTFTFYNATYGEIEPDAEPDLFYSILYGKREVWSIEKIDEDQWLRPSYFGDWSLAPDMVYTLTRVARGDGTPTEYFSEFVAFMQERDANKLVVFDSDSKCKRLCMGFFPCSFCNWSCGDK